MDWCGGGGGVSRMKPDPAGSCNACRNQAQVKARAVLAEGRKKFAKQPL